MFQTQKNKKFLLIIFFITFLLVVFHYIGILKPVENLIVVIFRPIQEQVYKLTIKIREYHNRWDHYHEMLDEINGLEAQAMNNLIDRSALKILEEENSFLRQQLDFIAQTNHHIELAQVIGLNNDGHSKNLIINRGTNNRILEGAPVLVDNVIVGKIFKAEKTFAIVRLVNDQFSQLAVTVLNSEKTVGLVKGEFGLGAKMEMIPQHEKIVEGDIIITSGLESKIPYGLVLGTVETVEQSDEAIFKTATINLPVNFDKIFMVGVLVE